MSWSINEVARMSGASSRTLRHYQAIGLLEPESTEFSGRRLYGQLELLRLQEILVLRELNLSLKSIREILDSESDRQEALRRHLVQMYEERDRIDLLIGTIEKTIEEGPTMTPEQIFEGVHRNPHEAEARERWGDEAIDRSNERIAKLTPEQIELLRTGFDRIHRQIETLHAEGMPADDPRMIEVIQQHYDIVGLTWEPNADEYIGLGRTYVEDPRFRESIGNGNDPMVEYLAEAMRKFAEVHLRE